MLIAEARSTLGLVGGESAEEVRRAYLRGVRQHPPEGDPKGFRRVREAYETLQAGAGASPFEVGENQEADPPFRVDVFDDWAGGPGPGGESDTEPTPDVPAWLEAWSVDQDIGGRFDAPEEELAAVARAEHPEGPVDVLLQSLLWSLERGDQEAAHRILGELTGPRGGELAATLDRMPHRRQAWVGARELQALPESFPSEAVSAIAGALRHEDPSRASDVLHGLVMDRRKTASLAAEHLESHAPLLNQMFGDLLSGPDSERYSKAPSAGLLGCLIWLLASLAIQNLSSEPTWQEREVRNALRAVETQTMNAEMSTNAARIRFIQSCRLSGSTRDEPLCVLAEETLADLQAQRCAEAQAHLDELQAFLDQTYPSEPTRHQWEPFHSLTLATAAVCSVETMKPEPRRAPPEPDPVR